MTIKDLKHPGLFAAGVLFGTAGIKALSSKDAKKLYTNCILRCRMLMKSMKLHLIPIRFSCIIR